MNRKESSIYKDFHAYTTSVVALFAKGEQVMSRLMPDSVVQKMAATFKATRQIL